MAQLNVHLVFGDSALERAGLESAVVHATVRDTSLADTEHPAVAATSSPATVGDDLTVDVPDGALVSGRRYSLFVHVDRSGDGSIDTGDLITTEDVPVVPGDIGSSQPVRAALRRI